MSAILSNVKCRMHAVVIRRDGRHNTSLVGVASVDMRNVSAKDGLTKIYITLTNLISIFWKTSRVCSSKSRTSKTSN